MDLSSKSDTERAASVWNAALPRKSVPDIDTLAELGRKLNWIKTWYFARHRRYFWRKGQNNDKRDKRNGGTVQTIG